MTVYRVADEFSDEPGGRFYTDGDDSGQEFREEHLKALVQSALDTNEPLILNFDGCYGLPTSFSEEAFGGLIRHNPDWPARRVLELVRIEAPQTPRLLSYVAFAQKALKRAVEASE